jgi:hypothetical protein
MTTQPISVPDIQAFDPADIDSVQAAFTKAPQFHFAQNWAEQTPPDLRNGTVRIGWQDDRLVYFADLDDRDIFTKATGRNQDLWKLGDVLEIFAGLLKAPPSVTVGIVTCACPLVIAIIPSARPKAATAAIGFIVFIGFNCFNHKGCGRRCLVLFGDLFPHATSRST